MSNQEHNEVPINTAPINKFVQAVKQADHENANEVKIKIHDAKRISFALTEVLSRLNGDLEELLLSQNQNSSDDNIEVRVDGGNDW